MDVGLRPMLIADLGPNWIAGGWYHWRIPDRPDVVAMGVCGAEMGEAGC